MSGKLEFIDLKTQYAALRENRCAHPGVLDHGQYILGPEVRSSRSGSPLHRRQALHHGAPAAPRRC